MSYCPKCGREILDESLGCPVCGVRENIDFSKKQEEPKAEPVTEFTVEDSDGMSHHFESNRQTGDAEYRQTAKPAAEATIHPVLKIIIIVLIVMVGGFGAIAGVIAGIVLMKSPAEDYRRFGKLMLIVSIVMLALSLLCCVFSAGAGALNYGIYRTMGY